MSTSIDLPHSFLFILVSPSLPLLAVGHGIGYTYFCSPLLSLRRETAAMDWQLLL